MVASIVFFIWCVVTALLMQPIADKTGLTKYLIHCDESVYFLVVLFIITSILILTAIMHKFCNYVF